MERTPLISVVIPAYNAEKYMAQCIENLLFQTYRHLEIILVDDGSTDDTAQIVARYPSVKYIHLPNAGNYAARNTGIRAATGTYLHFMDVDDAVSLDFYQKMVEAAIATEAEMVCCGFFFERFPVQSQRYEHALLASTVGDKLALTRVDKYGACWRYLFKTSFLHERALFFNELRAAQDRVFSLRAVYYANRIVSVPDAVYIYKNRAGSITTSTALKPMKKRHADRKAAEITIDEFARRHGFSLVRTIREQWQYKLLGLPLLSKRIFHTGAIKWYLFGIPVFQKKEKG